MSLTEEEYEAEIDRLHEEKKELSHRLENSELLVKVLSEKATALCNFVENYAYAPIAGYYERNGGTNTGPLKLLRLAVEDVDALTNRKGNA